MQENIKNQEKGKEQVSTHIAFVYRMGGNVQNKIKELKQDFGAEIFSMKDFYITETTLVFDSYLQFDDLFLLQEKTQKTLFTLHYFTFAIGAYFEKVGDLFKLKTALTKKH